MVAVKERSRWRPDATRLFWLVSCPRPTNAKKISYSKQDGGKLKMAVKRRPGSPEKLTIWFP
jgi:hypothetical protein